MEMLSAETVTRDGIVKLSDEFLSGISAKQGYAVAQSVEAPCYKPEGRGIESR
jgi:hypothetical protein